MVLTPTYPTLHRSLCSGPLGFVRYACRYLRDGRI